LQKVLIRHRHHIEAERFDHDLLEIRRRTEQRFEHAARDHHHAGRCIGRGRNESTDPGYRAGEQSGKQVDSI